MIDPKRMDDKFPVNTKIIRQAINYAIDREELVSVFALWSRHPATKGFVPPYLPGNKEPYMFGYTYDPDKANELLTQGRVP